MIRNNISFRRLGLVLLDLIIINFSYIITLMARLGYEIPSFNFEAYLSIAPWICITTVIIFVLFDLYDNWIHQSMVKVLNLIIIAMFLSTLITMSLIYMSHNLAMPRTVTIINPLIELLLLSTARLFIWSVYNKLNGKKRVMIIGQNEHEAHAVAKNFWGPTKGQYIVTDLCFIDDKKTMESKIISPGIDAIAMGSQLARHDEIINFCIKKGKEILVVPDILTIMINSAETHTVDDTVFFSLKPPGISSAMKVIKRTVDLVLSILGLILSSPVCLIIVILIRLTSPGSALFSQERMGEAGKTFQLLKFRSMISNAEELTGPILASVKDPRITKLGAFLRASRIDEIPQLINVLRGDMSMIGPRPEREFFVKQFIETIPSYGYRMAVKPGITGLAQVMGRYNTSAEDKLRFDLLYIRNCSLLLDFKILLLTIRVVFQKDKATGVEMNFNEAMKKLVS